MAYWAEEPGSPVPPARRGRVCSRCIHEISLLALPFTCHSRRRAVAPPVASSAGLRRAAVVAPFYQSLVPRAISTQDSFGPSKLCPQHIAPRRRDWAGRSEAEPARRASRTINYTRYRRGERASLPLAVQLLVVSVLARPRPAVSPSSSASPARCSACDGRPPTRRAATGLQPCPCSGLGSEAALRPRPARTPHPPAQSAVQTTPHIPDPARYLLSPSAHSDLSTPAPPAPSLPSRRRGLSLPGAYSPHTSPSALLLIPTLTGKSPPANPQSNHRR